MNKILKQFLIYFLVILLTIPFGVLIGIRNLDENYITSLEFSELHDDVKVYRDEWGIPTIVAVDQHDLFFAQGYEYARDRLFQAEFYRSVANGEISRLLGSGEDNSLIESDQFLKTLGLREAAEEVLTHTSLELRNIISYYIDGLNKFIDRHHENLPLEFQLVAFGELVKGNFEAIKPKKWDVIDVLAIQGVMAYDLAFGAVKKEITRQDLLHEFGAEKTLEIMPIMDPISQQYFLNQTANPLSSLSLKIYDKMVDEIGYLGFSGSNNWVINGSKSASGLPILSNDPHLGLGAASIWWQVHLISLDATYHTQGYALPGVPGIVLGHNDKVVWGFTNTGTDSIDLFYFNTRVENGQEQYFIDNQWKNFEEREYEIEVYGGSTQNYVVKYTDYGPVLDRDLFGITDDKTYAMRWTLFEDDPDNSVFDAIFGLNRATNADDVHDALRTFSVPGQNIVYATVDGDIGYQYTGFAPIRKVPGSGILPQNGSDPLFGWDGRIPYEQHLNVRNPDEGYFATANQKIDQRDLFYITDLYENQYRGERISTVLESANNFNTDDMRALQGDVRNLYAVDLLSDIHTTLSELTGSTQNAEIYVTALDYLNDWDYNMDIDSVGATIFATFRIYFEEQTFRDEFDATGIVDFYANFATIPRYSLPVISENSSSDWFDDISTSNQVEDRTEIVERSFELAINFLKQKLGDNPNKWTWGKLHKVVFKHPFGDNVLIFDFNEGNKAAPGSDHTVFAGSETPRWSEDGPEYIQDFGPSMRLVAEVESTWQNVEGIMAPGISGNYNDEHHGDSVKDWIKVINHAWSFTVPDGSQKPSFTFKKI